MSELQDLLRALSVLTDEAEHHAAELAQRSRRIGQVASQAAAVTQGSAGGNARSAAIALQSAQRSLAQAAAQLHAAAQAGRAFVVRSGSGVTGRGGPGSPESGPEFAPGATLEPREPLAFRYLSPTGQQTSSMAHDITYFGARSVLGWIGRVNPNYSTNDEAWTNNCGPCARSMADAYQGVSTQPAFGDGRHPPGEYDEMWNAVGCRPTTALTNSPRHADPASFTSAAYSRLSAQLEKEGPGAVAIIGVDWDDPRVPLGRAGGHWFNAYVDDGGVVRWADGQLGMADDWPPGYPVPIWNIEAVVRPSGGQPWKEVVL
ncbi:MAG TPA: toxin glutamine deamidase domain-containing protein [Pseudolysinimonas sp.]|jgi:hypothetical protein